jgi:predicted  nucleic acid-binding Zn-ribbon protein
MKVVWIASLAVAATTTAFAQSTIYKLVDESGRVTYSNKPMKGATVMELEPITIIQSAPAPAATAPKPVAVVEKVEAAKTEAKPEKSATAISPTLASVEPQVQRRRDNDRRRILEEELQREEESLGGARGAVLQEQQNPTLVAAVRMAQQATDPTASQMMEFRNNIEKASGRIRGLQATVAEHEKNIEALKKELGALKP